ncbi:HAMP domain-containing protein [Hahella sp. SMD15-11]|uniref:Sensor protein n=1 Tax=Thermohahella caldifontis TaxID=3142973 RepID=A0AB39USJ1_9GAMM
MIRLSSRLLASVSYQILGAFALVVLAALAGYTASLTATEQMSQDAERIDIAGSLRMLSTRAALTYYTAYTTRDTERVNNVLQSLKARLENPVLDAGSPESQRQLAAIRQHWAEAEAHFEKMALPPEYIRVSVEKLVDEIDQFVLSVQRDSEEKVSRMRTIQLLALLTVLLTSALMVYLIRNRVQAPLSQLVNAHQRLESGHFDTRLNLTRQDEFGSLAASFNAMSAQLDKLYHELEEEVAHQTRALNARNEGLNALFAISGDLHAEPISSHTLRAALIRMKKAIHARELILCLAESETPVQYCQLHTESSPVLRGLTAPDIDQTRRDCEQAPETRLCFPLSSAKGELGLLIVHFSQPAEPWQHQVCAMLASLIVQALSDHLEHEHSTRAALHEERTAIGRDLHDSLAQSLAYLKIQLTKGHRLLELARYDDLRATLAEAREGLNAAYSQLRELLTTFRLQISEPGLEQALRGACAEFAARGESLEIQLSWEVSDYTPDANDEIHLLQIVREALANVVKHSRATKALVKLSDTQDGRLELLIEDNGCGLDTGSSPLHHHGLRIMEERARALPDGTIEIGAITENGRTGTRIRVTFTHQRQAELLLKVVPHVVQ